MVAHAVVAQDGCIKKIGVGYDGVKSDFNNPGVI